MGKIKEVIVVEGKNDAAKIKQVFDADVFVTYGYHITPRKMQLLRTIAQKRGLILLLDPDCVGEMIRKKINDTIPGCKNAYIDKKDARTTKKVGIEHAALHQIEQALNQLIVYQPVEETISIHFLDQLNLRNTPEGVKNRERLSRKLHLGKCNFKALHKRLNLLQISESEIIEIVKEKN